MLSLIITQLVVLFLLIKTYRLTRKVKVLEFINKSQIVKILLNNLEKHGKKIPTNGKNKHQSKNRPARFHQKVR